VAGAAGAGVVGAGVCAPAIKAMVIRAPVTVWKMRFGLKLIGTFPSKRKFVVRKSANSAMNFERKAASGPALSNCRPSIYCCTDTLMVLNPQVGIHGLTCWSNRYVVTLVMQRLHKEHLKNKKRFLHAFHIQFIIICKGSPCTWHPLSSKSRADTPKQPQQEIHRRPNQIYNSVGLKGWWLSV